MSLVDLGKRLLDAAKLGHTEEVRTLMSNGAPFTTDWLGTSPLHYAVAYGHSATAEALLRAGISRDARTKVDRTPLHIAAQEGHRDIVDMLIRNGADIEAKDMLRMTPLHWAVEKCHTPVIEVLIEHAADISCENKFDRSPVDIALESGRTDIADMLQMSRENTVEITEQSVIEEVMTTEQEVLPASRHDAVAMAMGLPLATINRNVALKLEPDMSSDVSSDAVVSVSESSTAVLATLAALAGATAPLDVSAPNCTSAAETLNWLESQRISMISEAESIVTSSLSSGPTFTLTEAGKLALDIVSEGGTELIEEEVVDDSHLSQKMITITSGVVADDDIVEEPETPLGTDVTVLHSEDEAGEPASKRLCVDETAANTEANSLQLQLERAQREAACFKEQLLCKQREADDYKKQLTDIAVKPAAGE